MTMTDNPTTDPSTEWSQPFWDATREHRFVMQRCTSCDGWSDTARPRCPHCWRADLDWVEPSLEPRLHSWALTAGRGDVPARMVILVDVSPGLRLVSNLTGLDLDVDVDDLQIDEPLELTWLDLDDGRALPQFRRPTTAAAAAGQS